MEKTPANALQAPVNVPKEKPTDGSPKVPEEAKTAPAARNPGMPSTVPATARPDGIPGTLRQLMEQDGVRADEIQYAVAAKGYFPNDMPIGSYPADFVQGVLIGAWPQVREMVLQNRAECPF